MSTIASSISTKKAKKVKRTPITDRAKKYIVTRYLEGATISQITRELRRRGFRPPVGYWYPVKVTRVLVDEGVFVPTKTASATKVETQEWLGTNAVDDARFPERTKPSKGHTVWTRSKSPSGAGRFMRADGTRVSAARYAWAMKHGPLAKGVLLTNVCGNPSCVDPSHYARTGSAEAFWSRTVQDPESSCLLWQGNTDESGYGRIGGAADRAHRVAYRLHYGAIPAGWEIHHMCDNESCVSPFHLTAVPNAAEHAKLAKAEKEIQAAFESGQLQDELWLYISESEDEYQGRLLSRIGTQLATLEDLCLANLVGEAA